VRERERERGSDREGYSGLLCAVVLSLSLFLFLFFLLLFAFLDSWKKKFEDGENGYVVLCAWRGTEKAIYRGKERYIKTASKNK
jgi:hypothetical protein